MDNIKVLEEIGLKKVSDETHIEQKYIKYMVDCDFEKLNRINTLGFVKILSRAYKIDLSAWTEAFEEYWLETHRDDEDKGLFIVVDEKKQSRKLLIFILLIIIIATASFLFALFEDKINLDNYIKQDETSFEQSKIVEDTQKRLDEINTSMTKNAVEVEEDVEEQNQTENSETNFEGENNLTITNTVIEKIEEKIETQNIVEVNETIDNEMPNEEIREEVTKEVIEEQTNERFNQEAIVSPNIRIWLGVIYLDNKKRRSYLGEGNFSIDTSRDQIITTGHGSFTLTQNGEKKEFNKQAPLRFLVTNSNITEITFSEFKELNEGKSW